MSGPGTLASIRTHALNVRFRRIADIGRFWPAMVRSRMVESKRGAVAWAIRQRSVSSLRSSNRTGRFPASGSRTRLHAFALRATPSVVSEHSLEFIGCPISRSFPTYCVCPELRSFPPPALPGFSGTANLSATPGRPACPSRASG
jgi:hypothetical protein